MKVQIVKDILSANEQIAQENRRLFDEKGVFVLNIMAAPGAGKTSLIERTIEPLRGRLRIGVIEGDVASSIDADRIARLGIPAVQINTGGACHLDANMVCVALPRLPLDETDLLFIENVGNLICPTNFALGEHLKVIVASSPEGDDKPYKYPGMFSVVDVLVLNKVDLLPLLQFDLDYFRRGVEALNPDVAFFPMSCKTGEGVQEWIDWLVERCRAG
ncbi:MAG: hydrogenase accessory protein HypB [Chloroflexi bacterium]|nr:MAG: hydrogenase accessory protein HypB [Chloroflexota bacterium]RLC87320.1 MAG: hydrogenase accessory protein HypB [Chloroflexota bacterium]HEY68287.1 hydrogenase nickel incorporation protein HypB [Thermoflexia bacterium]